MKFDRPSHGRLPRGAQALALAAALLLSAFAPAFPQRPAPAAQQQSVPDEQDETIRVNTNLVQVDAVVLDKRGRQVTDLQAADFEIVEDGRARRPEFSSYVAVEGERAARADAADERLSAGEVRRSTVFVVANPLLEVKVNSFSDTRPFATVPARLYVSIAHTDGRAAAKLLTRFVGEQMGARELAAIRESEAPGGPLAGLTSDRSVLRRAIERVKESPLTKAPKVTVIVSDSSLILEQWVEQNLRVIRMMEDAVSQLEGLPGRRVLVLVSRGMLHGTRVRGTEVVQARMEELIAKANRARVTVYTLNPRGPDVANLRGGGLQDNGGLMALARETGGRAIFNSNDLSVGFADVLEENRGYYLLGYNPGAEAAARPHNIQVRARRPGLRVQARSTAYAGAVNLRGGPVSRPQLGEVLDTPLALREVKLTLTPLYLSADGKSARITSLVNIGLAGAEWRTNADGSRSVNLDVVGRVVAPDGRVVYQKGRNYALSVPAAGFERTLARGIDYWFDVGAESPGLYQVSVAVRDAVSGRAGNAVEFVEAADLARGGLGVSSLLLSGAADEAASAVASPVASPASPAASLTASPAATSTITSATQSTASPTSTSAATSTTAPTTQSTASLATQSAASPMVLREEALAAFSRREFRAGGTLRYQCLVYNAARGRPGGASSLQAQVTIRRGDAAQAVLPARPVSEAGDPAFVGGDIALGSLPPGRYTLEVTITDRRSRSTRAVVASDFHITN